jgi:hypothetical protein
LNQESVEVEVEVEGVRTEETFMLKSFEKITGNN